MTINYNKPIKSVAEFVNIISGLEINDNIYFRGQPTAGYSLVPSIARKTSLLENEHNMFREVISKAPNDFQNRNTLEALTLMQHYGLPTRILDVSLNSLVALYFACNANLNIDGEVFILDIPKQNIVHFDSHRVSILSNISKCNEISYTNLGYDIVEAAYEDILKKITQYPFNLSFLNFTKDYRLTDFINYISSNFENLNKYELLSPDLQLKEKTFLEEFKLKFNNINYNDDVEISIINLYYSKYLENLLLLKKDIIESINVSFLQNLISSIKNDIPSFQPRIIPTDLDNVLLVKPKMDNPRIIRQHGAFLIFGDKEGSKKNSISTFNIEWIKSRLIIDANYKNNILKELNYLGLNEVSLFPEIENVSKYIKSKYSV